MSNNKQVMKLYSEEQVERIAKLYRHELYVLYAAMKTETPIELPSDEEIEEKASTYRSNSKFYDIETFEDGAVFSIKYLRNKIQGGNNEQQKS